MGQQSGEKPPTLKDVALRAGVHPGTVSRTLNPETRSRVNTETAKRVLRVAKAMGYRPNPIARSLRTSRSQTVGMLIPDLTNPLFPPIVRGAEEILSARGYTMLLADTGNDGDREENLYAALRTRQVDGLIFGTALREHPLLDRVLGEGFPIVLLNRLTDGHRVRAVVGDESSGVRQVVDHLVGLGHRAIACIAGPQTTSTGTARLAAFRQAMAVHGLGTDPRLVAECTSWTEAEGARALTGLLAAGAGFTAVVCGNDMIALGCYDVVQERGMRCPGELSIVGYNDMPFVDKFAPPLTTVRQPNHDIGAEAAQLLLQQIDDEGDTRPKLVTLPVELIVRGSTSAPEER